MHTIEHLVAEYIRDEVSGVIDFSPMGCRTGFYFTLFGNKTEEEISAHLKLSFKNSSIGPIQKNFQATTQKNGNYLTTILQKQTYTQKWLEGIEKYGFYAINKKGLYCFMILIFRF